MPQAANTDVFNPLVPKAHNSELWKITLQKERLQNKPVKVS